jgi:hypothetical protein
LFFTRDAYIVRFAVLDLLAVTLVVTLATAVFVKSEAMSSAAAKLDALQTEIAEAADDCQEKEREFPSLTRITTRRATDFDLLRLTVDRIEDLSNQAALKITEPPPHGDAVSRTFIPTSSCRDGFRERTIIFVPADLVAELQVKFFGDDNQPDFFADFAEPSRPSVPLVSGENLIDVRFDWNQAPNMFTVTNHTSGVSLSARAKDARGRNWFPALGQGFYRSQDFSPRQGMTVFEGSLGYKEGTRIVVQMVGSKNQ